jgi:hypothetical protein
MKFSTNTTKKTDNESLMDGTESFEIVGNLMSPVQCAEIIKRCQGLTNRWHCLEKAQIAKRIIGDGIVVVGSCHLWSTDMRSNYGYNFNPPYEFHAWLHLPQGIIDIALPGSIEVGLNTHDDIGPYLTGREPFILAGKPLDWMDYRPVQIIG